MYQEVQKSFHSMGFGPTMEPFNHRVLGIVIIASLGITSEWIFLFYEADSAEKYLQSIYVIIVCTGAVVSFASTILIIKKLFSFMRAHEEYLNERLQNPASKSICEKTNDLVEELSGIGIFFMKYVAVPLVTSPKVIVSFFIYFTTDVGNDAFDLPVPMWFPYDWKSPTVYLVTIFIQYLLAFYPSQYIGCLMSFAFGCFMFEIAFVKILKDELHAINKMAKHKKSHRNMYKNLSEFIRRHGDMKQLFHSFLSSCEIVLTIVFTGCLTSICAAMLLIQIEISHDGTDAIVLLEAFAYCAAALALLLFICELGQRFSNLMDEVYEVIIQFNWYLFPSQLQRVLPVVVLSTQEMSVLKCFGNVSCTRKQFRKVLKTVFSYFMMLREFYK